MATVGVGSVSRCRSAAARLTTSGSDLLTGELMSVAMVMPSGTSHDGRVTITHSSKAAAPTPTSSMAPAPTNLHPFVALMRRRTTVSAAARTSTDLRPQLTGLRTSTDLLLLPLDWHLRVPGPMDEGLGQSACRRVLQGFCAPCCAAEWGDRSWLWEAGDPQDRKHRYGWSCLLLGLAFTTLPPIFCYIWYRLFENKIRVLLAKNASHFPYPSLYRHIQAYRIKLHISYSWFSCAEYWCKAWHKI